MRRRRLAAGGALVLVMTSAVAGAVMSGVSCGPVAPPSPSVQPVNACPASPCIALDGAPASCANGLCTTKAIFDFTLLLSFPAHWSNGPGETVAIPSFLSANPQCALNQPCLLSVPSGNTSSGVYIVEQAAIESAEAGAYIGSSPEGDGGAPVLNWALPVHAEYRPLWPPDASAGIQTEAALVGLPVQPIAAGLSDASAARASLGAPRGAGISGWSASLSPGFYYECDVVPDNTAFPALAIQGASGDDVTASLSVDTLSLLVTRSDQSLAGFTTWLRDATTLARLSSIATLGDSMSEAVTLLYSATQTLPAKLQIVIAPPDGSPTPYFADNITDQLLSPTGPGEQQVEEFPALPPQVTVSGGVQAADGTPIAASLVIDSVAPDAGPAAGLGGGIDTVNAADRSQPFMHYSTTTSTDPAGNWSVVLPPGNYSVFLTPATGAVAGAAAVTLVVAPPLASEPPLAAGKTLLAAAQGVIQGSAKTSDGRPLAGATIEARPSVSLAAVDPRRWPRGQTVTADASGSFTLVTDPGTYDVLVEPVSGTGFPWATVSSQVVTAGEELHLPQVVVAPPVVIDLSMYSIASLQPIPPLTLVRAFAPLGAGAVDASTAALPPLMVQIGEALTDSSGHVTMWLTPPR